jgi:hypothetical protein
VRGAMSGRRRDIQILVVALLVLVAVLVIDRM